MRYIAINDGVDSAKAAAVVKRIFDLCIAGKGPSQIAKILKADNVLVAKADSDHKGTAGDFFIIHMKRL